MSDVTAPFKLGDSVELPGQKFIAATGAWTEDATRVVSELGLKEVHLSVYNGWTDRTVAFLSALAGVEVLHVAAGARLDLEPIRQLRNLRLLSLAGDIKGSFDFRGLESLSELRLENWNSKKYASALHCKSLRVLAISNYTGHDLSEFAEMAGLEELRISHGKLVSLQGISSLFHLKKLTLQELNYLETVDGISGLSELEDLWIYRAKKLALLDGISKLKKLRSVTLTSVPSLKSLCPLDGCESLERLALLQNTNVADGDLQFLKRMPRLKSVRFTDRAHYNVKQAELAIQ